MCGGAAKIIKKIDPLRGGDVILDKLGLPNLLGDNGILATPDVAQPAAVASTAAVGDVNAASTAARDDEKRRRAAAAGLSSTILGGSTAGTTTGTKTLLGS
jgi:hypothetical protein